MMLLNDAKTEGGPYAQTEPGRSGSTIHINIKRYYTAEGPVRSGVIRLPKVEPSKHDSGDGDA